MGSLLIAVGAGLAFIVAYLTYGRWLGRKIFRISAQAIVPSVALRDDRDYVPTASPIVFGHHFTSIAGTGPIVGPAIAILWGWLPALLWVVLGSIFIGAVHDFGSLVVSLRNRGHTVGEISGRLLNPRVRILFLYILFMALTIVLAIFGLVIAAVFRQYPSAIFPCLIQIPLAILIGLRLHRQGARLLLPSLLVLGLMYLSVIYGDRGWLHSFNEALSQWPIATWVAALLAYCYVASVLPVWVLLQPRDYINSLQLITALGLLVLGLVAASFFGGAPVTPEMARPALELAAPVVNLAPEGSPAVFPFLFVTIACGAISGFHCLVSSGTSSKQLRSETDAQFVGYGGMLTEGFLATLVIIACAAGLSLGIRGADGGWSTRYGSWSAMQGLPAMVGAFVDGAANLLASYGMPLSVGIALMGVLVASFAATTLDTACRLQRYVVQELAASIGGLGKPQGALDLTMRPLQNPHGATLFAIALALVIAAVPGTGQEWSWQNAGRGGLLLWPLFGATNQLLGGLAFLVIAFYLWRQKLPVWFIVLPMIFMLAMPMWAMVWQIFFGNAGHPSWLSQGKWLLIAIGLASILLEIWMIVEAARLFPRTRGVGATSPA